jgi:hypothetical protein
MKFLREHLGPALCPHRFQHQAHDHVLREEERTRGAFASAHLNFLQSYFSH